MRNCLTAGALQLSDLPVHRCRFLPVGNQGRSIVLCQGDHVAVIGNLSLFLPACACLWHPVKILTQI
jgi:hypothetical protein